MILVASNNIKSISARKIIAALLLPFLMFGCSGENGQGQQNNVRTADVSKLDELSKVWPDRCGALARDVKIFYEALARKDWSVTYEYRTHLFKAAVKRDMYLNAMTREGGNWELLSYKILNVDLFDDKARLMMEFVEGIGRQNSYAVVWWKKENNSWRCEEAGPSMLSLFRRVCPPE